jgi:tRNA A-37 threonylcarbamoyl transferase component Bud32
VANENILIEYRSRTATIVTWLCVLTSPAWLIVPVVWATFIVLASLYSLVFSPSDVRYFFANFSHFYLSVLGQCFVGALYVGAFAAVSLIATDRKLIATENGLRLPSFLTLTNQLQTNIPWQKIQNMAVIGSLDDTYEKLKLQIDTVDGRVYTLRLGAMTTQDVEKLLLASEMWLPESARTPLLESLQQKFATLALPGRERSHRNMLADELDSRFTSAAFIPLEPGQVLDSGRLTVIRQIAFGGLSAVYLVQEDQHGLYVLKESVIPSQSKDELRQKALEMFRREVELLKRLDHPDIVKVVRAFRDNEREYLLLEYIAGKSLRQLVREDGARPETEVLRWAASLAETLVYLHGMNPPILHRDLTPENIIVPGDGAPKIIDFGVANELISNATATLVGKHCYISPEQFRGQATAQSDIYSLGGTLHYLLTASEPLPLSQSQPSQCDATITPAVNQLVADMTALDQEERIKSASELLARLTEIQTPSISLPPK